MIGFQTIGTPITSETLSVKIKVATDREQFRDFFRGGIPKYIKFWVGKFLFSQIFENFWVGNYPKIEKSGVGNS